MLAQTLLEAGNLPGANIIIMRAISERDDVADYYVLQGRINLALKKNDAALQSYSQALDLDASNVDALTQFALLNAQYGQTQAANDAADRLLVLQPQSLVGHQVKALAALTRNRFADATEYADKALALAPGDEGASAIKARILAKQGKIPEARALIDTALISKGETPLLLTTLLNINRKAGDAQKMVANYQRLMPIVEDDLDAQVDYANFLYKTGKADTARPISARVLAIPTVTSAQAEQVFRMWSEYDSDPLDAKTQRAIGASPNLPVVRATLRTLLLNGLPDAALGVMNAVPADKSQGISAIRAQALYAKGDISGAKSLMLQALREDKNNPDALLLRGMMELRFRNTPKAIVDLQSVISDDPLNPAAYDSLAKAFAAQRRQWRSRQLYEEALQKMPQNLFLLKQYLQFLHSSGDNSRAMNVARQFTRTSPASVRAWSEFAAQCRANNDASCLREAQAGNATAATLFALDDPPGVSSRRGLFGKI
ncbi:tetratricopeptide repeat protein [Sphingobium subterraneum]|uniref:Tetratricopeptide (TPR) repeat protein n=1 Tax=Sphingobium subterraneum TaxID=627688 RepID=A0A841IUZ0_9SPHN|nr:tetratricopeptide repeat protein [Sphingobium subterraneum]MBB6122493.1 tetratricopeptide (TPR) repeat protein [Sphingobium subterraneum]